MLPFWLLKEADTTELVPLLLRRMPALLNDPLELMFPSPANS
jgi:hypothetical protein